MEKQSTPKQIICVTFVGTNTQIDMDKNKYMLFSGTTKMADVILTDYRLLTLLPRFDIRLGFSEKTVTEVCEKEEVNEHFVLGFIKVYFCSPKYGKTIDTKTNYLRYFCGN